MRWIRLTRGYIKIRRKEINDLKFQPVFRAGLNYSGDIPIPLHRLLRDKVMVYVSKCIEVYQYGRKCFKNLPESILTT